MTITNLTTLVESLRSDHFLRYYETAFALRDAQVSAERRALLSADGALLQEPYLELITDYTSSPLALEEVARDIGLSPEFVELASLLLPPGVTHLYEHQEAALRKALARDHVVVTSGTGSGKTEAFLLPVLARLVEESRGWSGSDRSNEWYLSGKAPYDPQRTHRGQSACRSPRADPVPHECAGRRPAGPAAPCARQRRSARDWMTKHRPGQRFYFGRYTGRTPVSGTNRTTRVDELRSAMRLAHERSEALQRLVASSASVDDRLPYFLPRAGGAEVLSRWDMQDVAPDILITNYSMLNIALLRQIEAADVRSHEGVAREERRPRLHPRDRRAPHVSRYRGHRGRIPAPEAPRPARARPPP